MSDALFGQFAQALAAIAVAAIFLFAYRRHRYAALALVWVVWLVLPFVRRLFDLVFGFTQLDILSVLPFALTVIAGMVELRSTQVSRQALVVLGLAGASILVGVPAALDQPVTLAFGLLTYGGVLFAAPVGYADMKKRPDLLFGTLGGVLWIVVPIIAVYAIVQYYALPLLPWDVAWMEGADLGSLNSPEPGRIRAFSTLNAPGPFAAVAAVALIVLLAVPRFRPYTALIGGLAAVALTLTFVRSYWLAVAVGAGVYLLAPGRRIDTLSRIGMAAILAAGVVLAGWSHPTVQAIVARAGTVTTVTDDTSARARLDFARELVPSATSGDGTLGQGLGQSGAAVSIGGEGDYLLSDHGYLSVLYQSGIVGLGLMLLALGSLLAIGVRQAWRSVPSAALHVALLSMFLVAGFFMDIFYGVFGVLLWYTAGRILAMEDSRQEEQRRAAASAEAIG